MKRREEDIEINKAFSLSPFDSEKESILSRQDTEQTFSDTIHPIMIQKGKEKEESFIILFPGCFYRLYYMLQ